jgi:hypothetical protein
VGRTLIFIVQPLQWAKRNAPLCSASITHGKGELVVCCAVVDMDVGGGILLVFGWFGK